MTQAAPSLAPSPSTRFRAGERVVDRVHLRDLPNYGEGVVSEVFTTPRGFCFYVVRFDDGELRAVTESSLEPAGPVGVYTCGVPQ